MSTTRQTPLLYLLVNLSTSGTKTRRAHLWKVFARVVVGLLTSNPDV